MNVSIIAMSMLLQYHDYFAAKYIGREGFQAVQHNMTQNVQSSWQCVTQQTYLQLRSDPSCW